MIVDSHVHLWNGAHTPQPWMTEEHAAIARPFEPDDLRPLLERNGVDRAVLVQGACLDSDTDYLFEVAEREERIGAVTAWVCLEEPCRASGRLDELATRQKFRAVRHLIHNESDHWIVRAPVLESIALLEARNIILELPVVFPRHFDDVARLAERFPRLSIVIDHLGKPPISSPDMPRWETKMRAVARYPNVMAKISGLNTALEAADWSSDDLQPSIEVALDCLGPSRLMCGSDWPVMLLNGDYDRVWYATAEAVESTAPCESAQLLGENARRIYRLDPPAQA